MEDPDGVLPPDGTAVLPAAEAKTDSKKPVAWKDMPQKQQLAIITLSRLSEPLVQTSLQVRLPPTTPPNPTLKGITRREADAVW